MRFLFVLACASACVLGGCGSSSDAPSSADVPDGGAADGDALPGIDPRVAHLVATATKAIGDAKVPGASIALVVDGKLFWAGGVGVRKAGGAEPCDGATLFRAASMSKMVVAATVESLAEDGAIDLTKPVTAYLPSFTLKAPYDATAVHVDELLSHTAGLPDESPLTCPGDASLADYFAHHVYPLWSPPGRVFDYSNTGFALAGLVAQTVAGSEYAAVAKTRVLDRAGMMTATYDVAAAMAVTNRATGHAATGTASFEDVDFDAVTCPFVGPPGGLIASVTDYAHLAEAFLAPAPTWLPKSRIDAMMTPHVSTHTIPTQGYGYGLFEQALGDARLVWHTGDVPGYHSMLSMIPEKRFAVVIMMNGDQLTGTSALQQITNDAILQFALPAHVTPSPIRTDPSTWGIYAGTYVDDVGALGTVTVTLDGGVLSFDAPALQRSGVLTQAATDTFVTSDGIGATFWTEDGGPAAYLVSRIGVAARR